MPVCPCGWSKPRLTMNGKTHEIPIFAIGKPNLRNLTQGLQVKPEHEPSPVYKMLGQLGMDCVPVLQPGI